MKTCLITFLFISLIFLSPVSVSAKKYQPHVKGGFKSLTLTDYRYESGYKDAKSIEKTATLNFDEKGNQIEIISYSEGKVAQKNKIENKYNSDGLLIESVYFDVSGNLAARFTFHYDNNTNIIYDTTYNALGEVKDRGAYKYDKNDFLIEETHDTRIDKNEFISGTTYYTNDKFGNKIEESAARSTDISAEVKSELSFDNNQNKTDGDASVQSNSSTPSTVTYEYTYDKDNNIIKEIRTSFDNFKSVKEFIYDKFGNILEELFPDENNKIVLKVVYEYSK